MKMNTLYYTSVENEICKPVGKYSDIGYLFIDVDGTMTDGGIYYDESGNELKKFCSRDAAGFFAAKACGIKIIILTGRKCIATEKRMKELQVDMLQQDVVDKYSFLKKFMLIHQISAMKIGYIGDDLNDFESMYGVGFKGCPADAVEEIKAISNYVSSVKGGEGAVRDIVKYLLMERGQWESAIVECYKIKSYEGSQET